MLYNFFGVLSSIMFLGCLVGLIKQFKLIQQRKSQPEKPALGFATQSLSVNSFFSSFIGFYAFFVYSIMLDPIDYYLLVTRLLAASMTMTILYAIYTDRAQLSQKLPFVFALIAMLVACVCLGFREELLTHGKSVASLLTVAATVIMVQGGIGQIRKIRHEQSTGVLSKSMNILFMCKDLSNVAFGLVLDFNDGWPLILLGSCSSLIKMYILYQFKLYKTTASIAAK